MPVRDPVEIIRTSDDLAGFERASVIGFGSEPTDVVGHTYLPGLLAGDRYTFFGRRIDGKCAAGEFLFEDPAASACLRSSPSRRTLSPERPATGRS